MPVDIDDIDLAILHRLQVDARHNTNTAISDDLDVSASTVGKRLKRLEAEEVITGYVPLIDYERAGFPLHVLFVCTAPISGREDLVEGALGLDGVVGVRELMTGDGNVQVEAIGTSNDDVTRIARRLDRLGLTIRDEVLVREERTRPWGRFGGIERLDADGE